MSQTVDGDYPLRYCSECGEQQTPYEPLVSSNYLWLVCNEYRALKSNVDARYMKHDPYLYGKSKSKFNPKTGKRNS